MNNKMRVYHRYLGFFLAGIMGVYAVSGVLLIFRNTDFLKHKKTEIVNIPADTKLENLGAELRIRDFKIDKTENGIVFFKQGTYNPATGEATIVSNELPTALKKLTALHKANTNSPLFFLNIFFGISLLFFVISAFWMFIPSSDIFKKGLYFSLAGVALVLLMLMF